MNGYTLPASSQYTNEPLSREAKNILPRSPPRKADVPGAVQYGGARGPQRCARREKRRPPRRWYPAAAWTTRPQAPPPPPPPPGPGPTRREGSSRHRHLPQWCRLLGGWPSLPSASCGRAARWTVCRASCGRTTRRAAFQTSCRLGCRGGVRCCCCAGRHPKQRCPRVRGRVRRRVRPRVCDQGCNQGAPPVPLPPASSMRGAGVGRAPRRGGRDERAAIARLGGTPRGSRRTLRREAARHDALLPCAAANNDAIV